MAQHCDFLDGCILLPYDIYTSVSYLTGMQDRKYPECRLTGNGKEYIGKVSKTESGKDCLRWDSQPYGTPDDFSSNVTYEKHFSNLDTWSHQNYCRNPTGKERPWCFVSDHVVGWEYCDIPMCTNTGRAFHRLISTIVMKT